MKILVFSDSHGRRDLIDKALRAHPDTDVLIHAGDGYDDVFPSDAPVVVRVPGNCDRSADAQDHIIFEAEGVRFLVTHGNLQKVSYGLTKLAALCRSMNCGIAVFGHTHHAVCTMINGVMLLNPGTANRSRSRDHYISYAEIRIENGKTEEISISYL